MNVKKVFTTIFILVIFAVYGIISIINQRPSFEFVKGNNAPVEYSAETLKIKLNDADVKDIERLDGIGHTMAMRIIAYRDEIGGFTDISQLLEIKGMGEKKLDAIKDDIVID